MRHVLTCRKQGVPVAAGLPRWRRQHARTPAESFESLYADVVERVFATHDDETSSTPGTATTRPSAPSARTSRSGANAAGECYAAAGSSVPGQGQATAATSRALEAMK